MSKKLNSPRNKKQLKIKSILKIVKGFFYYLF